MNGVEYGFIPDLDELSLGEYIDLDGNISKWEQMHIAMNVLYRPIKNSKAGKYNIVDYDVNFPEGYKRYAFGMQLLVHFFFSTI